MRFKMMVLVGAVSIATPAFAQTANSTDVAPKKEKKICRSQGPATGSMLSAPAVCHTKAEWSKIDDANGRNASNMLEGARAGSGRPDR